MAQNRLSIAAATRASGALTRPRDRVATAALRIADGFHYVPNDGRRFPICGSWRSNWNHTGDPDRATCPECRARLVELSTLPPGSAEEK